MNEAPPNSLSYSPGRSWTRTLSWGFSIFAFATLALMGLIFLWQSLPVWKHEGLGLLTGEKWYFRQKQFGGLSMIYGATVVALIAMLIAAPIGIGAAIFTAEIIPARLRLPVKAVIELLAGVPSVIYGLLGILFLRNWVYDGLQSLELLSGDTLLTAGLLLAVMVLPTIMTFSDDALTGVPASHRRAARGLGLTLGESVLFVSLPQAWKGIVAAVTLALGRALGEGIAVFMVIGRQDNQMPTSWFSWKPLLEAGQTLTSKLVGSETNIAYGDPLHWGSMVALGLVLMVMASGLTIVAVRLMRNKEAYATRD